MDNTFLALLIPFLGTAIGAAFVFFMKKAMPDLLQKILLGFASGVMVIWSVAAQSALRRLKTPPSRTSA